MTLFLLHYTIYGIYRKLLLNYENYVWNEWVYYGINIIYYFNN